MDSSTGEDELLTAGTPLYISPDVGNDLMGLPTNLARMIIDEIGDVNYSFGHGNDNNPTVPCAKAGPDTYLSF